MLFPDFEGAGDFQSREARVAESVRNTVQGKSGDGIDRLSPVSGRDPGMLSPDFPEAGLSTATSSVWLLAAWGAGAGASIVINVVAARVFAASRGFYGDFALVLATLVWVEYAISSTFPISYQKVASESVDNLPRIAHSVVRLCLPLCLALWVAFSLASPLIAWLLGDSGLTVFFLWAGPDIPMLGLYSVAIGVLNGAGRTGQMSLAAAAYAVGRMVLITGAIVVFVLAGAGNATAVSAGLFAKALASGLGLVIAVRYLRRIPHAPDPGPYEGMRGHVVRFGLPLGVTTIALYLLINIDFWLVKRLLEDKTMTDFYAAARAVAFLAIFVGIAMRNAVFPAMASNLHRGNTRQGIAALNTALRVVLLVAGLLVALLPATAHELMLWVFKYDGAGPPTALLVVATALFAVLMVYVMAFAAADRPLEPFFLLMGLVPLAVVGHLVLIPQLKITGAAMVTLAAMGLGLVAAAAWLWRRLGARPPFRSLVRIGAVVAAVALASRLVPVHGAILLPKYAVMAAAYALLLLAVREVRLGEVARLSAAVRGKLGARP